MYPDNEQDYIAIARDADDRRNDRGQFIRVFQAKGRSMDQRNHQDYYLARAEVSRGLAQRATNPVIAAIHVEFANRYDSMAVEIMSIPAANKRVAQAA